MSSLLILAKSSRILEWPNDEQISNLLNDYQKYCSLAGKEEVFWHITQNMWIKKFFCFFQRSGDGLPFVLSYPIQFCPVVSCLALLTVSKRSSMYKRVLLSHQPVDNDKKHATVPFNVADVLKRNIHSHENYRK